MSPFVNQHITIVFAEYSFYFLALPAGACNTGVLSGADPDFTHTHTHKNNNNKKQFKELNITLRQNMNVYTRISWDESIE